MALTPSNMVPLGATAPDFSLPEPRTGKMISKSDFDGKPLLVMFICNHCPFVVHVLDELVKIGKEYGEKGVGVVAISSNDVTTHPDDAPEKMAALAEEEGFAYDAASPTSTTSRRTWRGRTTRPARRTCTCTTRTTHWRTAGSSTARAPRTACR